jgi:hypothetical protein
MVHLKEAIKMLSPTTIIFNHDCAAPQGICKNCGPKDNLTRYLHSLLSKSDSLRPAMEFLDPSKSRRRGSRGSRGRGAKENNVGLFNQGGVPSFVLEPTSMKIKTIDYTLK